MSDESSSDGVEVDAAEIAQTSGLACVMRGQFALYQRDNGNMEIFFDVGEGMQRKAVPAPIVKALTGQGPLAGVLRKAFGG